MLVQRNQVFFFLAGRRILQDQAAFPADGAPEFHNSVDLRDFCRLFRTSRFEQLSHSRQTSSDVFRFRDFSRRLSQKRSSLNLFLFLDDDMRARRN